jgi:hypothetical protein
MLFSTAFSLFLLFAPVVVVPTSFDSPRAVSLSGVPALGRVHQIVVLDVDGDARTDLLLAADAGTHLCLRRSSQVLSFACSTLSFAANVAATANLSHVSVLLVERAADRWSATQRRVSILAVDRAGASRVLRTDTFASDIETNPFVVDIDLDGVLDFLHPVSSNYSFLYSRALGDGTFVAVNTSGDSTPIRPYSGFIVGVDVNNRQIIDLSHSEFMYMRYVDAADRARGEKQWGPPPEQNPCCTQCIDHCTLYNYDEPCSRPCDRTCTCTYDGGRNVAARGMPGCDNSEPALHVFLDCNGDGFLDVITACGSTPLEVHRNDGRSSLLNEGLVTGAALTGISAGDVVDVDEDGDMDLVLASERTVSLLRNNGTCGFSLQVVATFAADVEALAAMHADADGALDIVVITDGTMRVLPSVRPTKRGDSLTVRLLDQKGVRTPVGSRIVLRDGSTQKPFATRHVLPMHGSALKPDTEEHLFFWPAGAHDSVDVLVFFSSRPNGTSPDTTWLGVPKGTTLTVAHAGQQQVKNFVVATTSTTGPSSPNTVGQPSTGIATRSAVIEIVSDATHLVHAIPDAVQTLPFWIWIIVAVVALLLVLVVAALIVRALSARREAEAGDTNKFNTPAPPNIYSEFPVPSMQSAREHEYANNDIHNFSAYDWVPNSHGGGNS